ncbi:hypothetical protein [Haloferula sargassicola]|uniref:hypothetical protein n=1 Tax=Haloferula sargassicola TaxID=490096 RepID=UPI0033653079
MAKITKAGYAISPMSGKEVFIEGLEAGTVMRDPEFPDDEHGYFVVPEVEEKEPGDGPAVATAVPGKAGFVFSPFNNKIIDVKGIPPGTLVVDPTFPPSEKKCLRVPADPNLIVTETPQE